MCCNSDHGWMDGWMGWINTMALMKELRIYSLRGSGHLPIFTHGYAPVFGGWPTGGETSQYEVSNYCYC